jgi:hypothetical protein
MTGICPSVVRLAKIAKSEISVRRGMNLACGGTFLFRYDIDRRLSISAVGYAAAMRLHNISSIVPINNIIIILLL